MKRKGDTYWYTYKKPEKNPELRKQPIEKAYIIASKMILSIPRRIEIRSDNNSKGEKRKRKVWIAKAKGI